MAVVEKAGRREMVKVGFSFQSLLLLCLTDSRDCYRLQSLFESAESRSPSAHLLCNSIYYVKFYLSFI